MWVGAGGATQQMPALPREMPGKRPGASASPRLLGTKAAISTSELSHMRSTLTCTLTCNSYQKHSDVHSDVPELLTC